MAGQHLRGARRPGPGVGRLLLGALVASAERAGIWTVQTGIFPENQASVRRDVQPLERRSPLIT